MGDADDQLHDANQPSRNDVFVDAEEDQNFYEKLSTQNQTFLPFLMKVIDNSELLGITPDRVSKLRYWYKLVDEKRVSPDKLKSCKQLLYDLYNTYCKRLNYHLPLDFKTSCMQETKLNEFELCNKIPVPSTSYEKNINNQINCLEDFTVDIPSKVNKDELDSTSEQNSILINPTDQSKPKKHKKYSLSKEFENIIKDAAKSLNDDVCGPRTRSSVMKKEGIIKTIKISNSKPKFEKDNTTKNYEKLESGECSKNLDNGSIPNLADVRGRTEIGHNIISSTLNDQSGVANSTTTEIVCKIKKKNIVSSNEINSKADNSPKIEEKALIDILKNPKFMAVMRLLKDEDKMEKLKKFLENDYIQIKNKPINIKVAQERKSKKPFVGPLSVKLARQKMEMEKKNSQSECNIKNPFEFETKKIGKGSKSIEQANQSPKEETRITTEPLAIEYFEYTLKEKSKKCVIAGLSCELMNSMLVFKCSVSNCLEIQFSTVIFTDFSEHVNKNHQFVVWDRHCEACHHKLPKISEQYYVRNALEHLVSHHLVLKNNEQHPNTGDRAYPVPAAATYPPAMVAVVSDASLSPPSTAGRAGSAFKPLMQLPSPGSAVTPMRSPPAALPLSWYGRIAVSGWSPSSAEAMDAWPPLPPPSLASSTSAISPSYSPPSHQHQQTGPQQHQQQYRMQYSGESDATTASSSSAAGSAFKPLMQLPSPGSAVTSMRSPPAALPLSWYGRIAVSGWSPSSAEAMDAWPPLLPPSSASSTSAISPSYGPPSHQHQQTGPQQHQQQYRMQYSGGDAARTGMKRVKPSGALGPAARYKCAACSKTYSAVSWLTKHQQYHCAKTFRCKYCDKAHNTLGALNMHIRTHTGEKPFSCQHCNRAFANRSNLRTHLQTHSDE